MFLQDTRTLSILNKGLYLVFQLQHRRHHKADCATVIQKYRHDQGIQYLVDLDKNIAQQVVPVLLRLSEPGQVHHWNWYAPATAFIRLLTKSMRWSSDSKFWCFIRVGATAIFKVPASKCSKALDWYALSQRVLTLLGRMVLISS